MRRATAAVSVVLLMFVSIAVAEATLLALLVLFASVLRLDLWIEIGGHFVQAMTKGGPPFPEVSIRSAGTIASALFTLAIALAAATWRYVRWRPAT